MYNRHFEFWPKQLSRHLTIPETSLFHNVEVSARRFPNKPCLIYYDTAVSFAEFKREVELLAGFLQTKCAVMKGDRVLLLMQNSPQFILAYYAILRADAVAIPVSRMSVTAELRHVMNDAGVRVMFVSQDLYPQAEALGREGLKHIIVASYSDYLRQDTDLNVPEAIRATRQVPTDQWVTPWSDALAANLLPGPHTAAPDDLCIISYTSGTTGQPKGCMHSHRTLMHTLVASMQWFGTTQDAVMLAVLPFSHVTGMQGSMNGPIFTGSTTVLLPVWDRDVAARLIQRYRVTAWTGVPAIIADFLRHPRLDSLDLSSINRVSGGGAAMPEATARRLFERCGLTYVEGYGLTETAAPTHLNPPQRAKQQRLGIPIYDTDARVVDPDSLNELPQGELGEIVVSGPQVFLGYWNNADETRAAFLDLDGKRFFRTGDIGRVDEEGYFELVDRLKRMINVGGNKIWPAEIEASMGRHPAIHEVCVIAANSRLRGETIKALVVLRDEFRGRLAERDLVMWARENMAPSKAPRAIAFRDSLPKSATGKIQWRELQEIERRAG